MEFHDVRFPAALSFGSVGGPERRTEIVALANGFEERNTPWAHSRRRYDAGVGVRSLDDLTHAKTHGPKETVRIREGAGAMHSGVMRDDAAGV